MTGGCENSAAVLKVPVFLQAECLMEQICILSPVSIKRGNTAHVKAILSACLNILRWKCSAVTGEAGGSVRHRSHSQLHDVITSF